MKYIQTEEFAGQFDPCVGWVVMQRSFHGGWSWYEKLTFAGTRSESIQKYTDHVKAGESGWYSFHGGQRGRPLHYKSAESLWRAEQRAGLVKCVKVELIPKIDPACCAELDKDARTILDDVHYRMHRAGICPSRI